MIIFSFWYSLFAVLQNITKHLFKQTKKIKGNV